ncbi:ehrab7g protein, putative [Entamoeba invadens IP1]|uniref:ehrab7g protein, putative n=1 Tax=Entamoeba invadens IP1 TaxID=370355 RepID=UPI0002C3CEF9|nr:ehrab7g protein, putative [Entamoeba invadens IP1]ELP90597.1 ehrab7g protein, putative [Entamoeba invadens IP1]|eukprot:XP_004257368.1 ehrab7g protein, putative [Entamoeba invadens IP1]
MKGSAQMLKIILIGSSGVGKTSIIQRFVTNKFDPIYKSTIGCDFLAKTVNVDGRDYSLQIWDTAGHERFSSIVNSFYRGSDGAIVVFDVTSPPSFTDISGWIGEFEKGVNSKEVPIVIAANKVDVDSRMVSEETGRQWAVGRGYTYVETSAATSNGVSDLFVEMVKAISAYKKGGNDEGLEPIPIGNVQNKEDGGCC